MMTSTPIKTFSIENESLRLDQILVEKFPSFSRTYFQFLIKEGFVAVNGKSPKKGVKPARGDTVSVTFTQTPETKVTPEDIPLEILFEDDHLIALAKPRGLVVHPGAGNRSGTLANALLFHTKTHLEVGDELRPGIVHRLDKETSGVIICAKTKEAHAKLVDLFKKREVEKKYLAVTESSPKEGLLSEPIGRHKFRRKEMCVTEEGKEAITLFKCLLKEEKRTLVLAEPKTGRTHQIRVHLKHLKAPIVGDAIYGKKDPSTPMLLHAFQIKFTHPFTHQTLCITAKPPEEFSPFLKKLKFLEKYVSDIISYEDR